MMQPEEEFSRRRGIKRSISFQSVSDIARAAVILVVAFVLLLGNWLKIEQIQSIDPLLRYMFGGISLLYGGFRLYRGIWVDKEYN